MVDLAEVKRTISGKGEIKIPIEYAKAKNVYLYTQVIRRVRTPSINFTWNPDKGFYAHVCFCIDDFVLQTFDINFKQQVFYIYDGMSAQILVSLICATRQILGAQPSISAHTHNIFQPNRIKFECFADTAIELTLKGEKLDLCEESDSQPNAPPNPPPPIPELPPGTATEVDQPYEDDPDGENTEPAAGDEFKPDPGQGDCTLYQVDTVITFSTEESFESTYFARGPVTDARILNSENGSQIQIESKGASDTQNVECGEFGWYTVGGGPINTFSNIEIIAITEIPG